MVLAVEYLRTHTLQQLSDEHGVNSRFSNDLSKISLNYDQIAAKPGDPLADQCRGLIIRRSPFNEDLEITPENCKDVILGNIEIVAHTMDRFYNAGDVHAAPIDWTDKGLKIYEKLDGTMAILYHDRLKNEWCVGTRSVPEADLDFFGNDANGAINSPLSKNTFYELFKYSVERTLKEVHETEISFEGWAKILNKEVTYIYELTTPLNRVVVKYEDYRVTLLAARVTGEGKYLDCYNKPSHLGYGAAIQVPKTWQFNNINSLIAFVNNSNPADIEGAVVVDSNFNRLKVKSKLWVLASRAKDLVTLSKRNALESIINGTVDDIIPLLSKEIVEHLENMRTNLIKYCKNIDNDFCIMKSKATVNDAFCRKTFALQVQNSDVWQVPYFSRLYPHNGSSTLEWLQKLASNEKLTDSVLDALLNRML